MLSRIARATLLVLLVGLMLAACSPAMQSRPTAVLSYGTRNPLITTPTPMPTFTPTPAPLGSPENPIVMALIAPSPVQAQLDAFNTLTSQLSIFLNLTVTGKFYPNYLSLETALQNIKCI